MSRVQGTVKWFSNKSGYGFIEPTSDNAPTRDDIFVHQSSVKSDGYRTLNEGWIVAFDVATDENGKLKADNVTAPDGGPCTGPRRRRRKPDSEENGHSDEIGGGDKSEHQRRKNNNNGRKQSKKGAENGGAAAAKKQSLWHDVLSEAVKTALDTKGIRRTTGTIDVSVAQSRIKLGTRDYTSMAQADGTLAEGTFSCSADGEVRFSWERALLFKDGSWTSHATSGLLGSLALTDDSAIAVGKEETPETLWGEGKTDPKEDLEKAGFQMRRVVLTPKPKPVAADASKE